MSKAPHALKRFLAELELNGLFDAVVNSARVGFVKPDPDIFRITMKQTESHPLNAV